MKVLTLDQNYEPIGLISWKRAVALFFLRKATILEEYEQEIHSINFSMKLPSVIVTNGKYLGRKKTVNYSRRNIWIRDKGLCQYCSKPVTFEDLTTDHVVPKVLGGKTSWDNIVTCCYTCNQKKGDKTLKNSHLTLKNLPKKPTHLPFIGDVLGTYSSLVIPPTWHFWLGRHAQK